MNIELGAVKNIEYEDSYVAFLDVLGFKELVFSKKKSDKHKLSEYFGVVNSAIDYLKQIPSKRKIGSIIISDSVILSVPHGNDADENLDRIRHLCVAIGIIQHNLALKDIWVRGAISSGEAYFDQVKGQVVGPAYINSYLLESSSAIYPRVIIDSKIIKELKYNSATDLIDSVNESEQGGLHYSNWGASILYNWTYPNGDPVSVISHDVALFIDYLSPVVEENGRSLLKIVTNIERSMYNNTHIYGKYRWIADYLKSLCKREELMDNVVSSEAGYRIGNL